MLSIGSYFQKRHCNYYNVNLSFDKRAMTVEKKV